jgi:hypothetical protein
MKGCEDCESGAEVVRLWSLGDTCGGLEGLKRVGAILRF